MEKDADVDPVLESVLEYCEPAISEKTLKEIREITAKSKIDWENGTWIGSDGVKHKYCNIFEK